jgi:hypothetical protein
MHKVFRLIARAGVVACAALAPVAHSEVLTVPEEPVARADLPSRGMNQTAVTRQFGEPLQRHAPVGGGSPQHPPITRWDYDGWSVFYENNVVIDVVVKGAPKPLHNVDELQAGP